VPIVPPVSSYEIAASFYASREGRDVKLSQGGRVRPGDKLFAVVDSSLPVYVYIVNRDDAGKSFLLFPLPEYSPGNPLPNGHTARLPGTRNGQQYYWKVTSAGGQEHFYIYVRPQRWIELEQVFAALPRAELGRSVDSLPLSSEAIGILRGVGGVSPESSSSSTSSGTELPAVPPLGDANESADGVWARQISLQNPAE
jgi:hypothetical protein